ncbi:MAG: acyltransferase domain-containing protein, partial [Cyanobacteria bacterium J083]
MSDRFSNFVELLSDKANQTPDKVAFTFLQDGETESACLTYRQLDIKAQAIAAQLQIYKAQGERVLLLYQPGLEFIAAFLGCLYAGAIATPAYPPRANRSIERILAIIADAEAKFALTTGDLIGNIQKQLDKKQIKNRINLFATDILDLNLANNWQKPEIEAKQIAFLQYTSGSTGLPKGVMVSHGNLIANSATINHCFQNNQTHRAVSWLPPYHDMGLIGCILQPIYVGVSMYLMPPVAFLQRPYRWLKAISHYRAHTSGAPNFAYDLCVNQISPTQRDSLDLSCWQLAFTGAEPVRAETLSKFAAYFAPTGFKKQAFYPCYGMAESTLLITGGDKHESVILADFDSEKIKQNIATYSSEQTNSLTLVSCGRNVVGQKLLIVNPETCQLCAAGEIGEIWVKSPSVAQGYWRRPELTHFSFNASPLDREETGFLRTGDLGFLQDDELYVTGRLKDLIIIRGKNHYPQDIELTLDSAHEAIRPGCSAAFSVEIEGEEKLVVVQEIKRSYWRSVEAETVIKAIRQVIARKHELQVYAVLLLKPASIPKTSSGKIQRHACREGFLTDSLKVVAQWRETEQKTSLPPSYSEFQVSDNNLNNSPITNWLIAKVAEKVGIAAEKIKIDEPFANYGLDSLQAVKISAELEDWLKIKLSPTIVYDYPSIATLSQYLQAKSFPVTSSISATPLASAVPIAIIGMGCRLPGAENPEAFWQLLSQGIDAIRRQSGRWQGEEWGGYLDDVDLFDPQFFSISPREAQRLDPQQRLLLEVVWEALEYGGIAPDKLAGSKTGVFVGISSSDYSHLQFHYGVEVNAYSGTGNAHSIAANRLSYILDLHGPSLTVDTACSSSLVAVHLACQSLKQGECDQAIVGGVNLLLSPELTRTFRQAGMMASDGRCKTFDNAADGYVRGEGCGAIILKRLEEAVQDGDRILAVIKGSAVNQDGKSNGLTAPNGIAQQQVIRQALANAGVEPEAVSYIETHGTGTSLGDPIEVNSLKAVFANSQRDNCYLGAVKTNIGHLEAAAGIAGLIKAILCLQNQQIVPNLHFSQLNSYIDLQATGLKIPTKLQAWQSKKPLTAGISSFGFGGTNAHLILSQVVAQPSQVNSSAQTLASRSFELLTLSAKEPKALTDLAAKYANYLQNHLELCLADLCYTANTGRSHFDYRLAVVASSTLELQQKLANISSGEASAGIAQNKVEVKNESNNKIAFLFTGQGSQYRGMGYELYCSQPVFRQALERCEEILSPYLDIPLLEILYPKLSPTKQTGNFINRTLYTQPAIFALEYALAQLWLSWGIEPSVVIGHSVGEYVAACIAGVFSLEEGLKLIASRAKLMENLPTNGEMAAVFTDEDTIKQLIEQVEEKEVSIAAINSPQNTVISGESKAVKNLLDKLRNLGIKAQKLNVSHAFHSPLMQPILAEFTQIAESVTFNLPRVKIISN